MFLFQISRQREQLSLLTGKLNSPWKNTMRYSFDYMMILAYSVFFSFSVLILVDHTSFYSQFSRSLYIYYYICVYSLIV